MFSWKPERIRSEFIIFLVTVIILITGMSSANKKLVSDLLIVGVRYMCMKEAKSIKSLDLGTISTCCAESFSHLMGAHGARVVRVTTLEDLLLK